MPNLFASFLISHFLLLISVGLSLFQFVVSQISLGSNLSVVENNSWSSPNGDFALGFFPYPNQPNQFGIGIHFNSKSIPFAEQTVVWVAGAGVTVGNNSHFQLTQNGELVLFDDNTEVPVWSTNTAPSSVVSAILRNDGNLVLLNRKRGIVWQSFDTPSDTILPGQILSGLRTLRASSTDPVSSYYTLGMNSFGQLNLRWESSVEYWSSKSVIYPNSSLVLTMNGTLQLLEKNLKPLWSVFGGDHGDDVKYRFLRLDMDGNLRLYSWFEDLKLWRSVWQAVENQCDVFATCGKSGVCLFNSSGNSDCKCPFKTAFGSNSVCLLPDPKECASGFSLVAYEHMYLYGMYPANDSVFTSSLEQCRKKCLDDSQCMAVTYANDGSAQCRMKKTRYVSGYSDPSIGSISYVKDCSTNSDPLAVNPNFRVNSPPPSMVRQSFSLSGQCLIGAALGTSLVFLVIQIGIGVWVFRRRKLVKRKALLGFMGTESKSLIVFSFCEIKEISENFKHEIGPNLFKGIKPVDNQVVAIKQLDGTIEERRFRNVVTKIGNIHHKNLVKTEGYCCELSHRYLVYEFFENGSLKKYLEDSELCKVLTWRKRIEVCVSVAKALCYLHHECREFVSHGRLKCENVILDENLEAKITEFGLANMYNETYAAKDVEDFGKMVLVLVCGHVQDFDEGSCEWGYKEWMEGRGMSIVDERIVGGVDLDEVERILRLAFWCLQRGEHWRPSMSEVLNVLEGTLAVDPPPSPFARRRMDGEEEEESSDSGLEL